MKTLALVILSLIAGIIIGYFAYESQNIKTYEDGSYYGCKIGGLCND